MTPTAAADRQLLVLAGGGHTHALLLRRWRPIKQLNEDVAVA